MLNPIKTAYNFLIEHLPPEPSLKVQYARYHFRIPNLKAPKLFSEKVQYRKLHDRSPMLPLYADKVKAKLLVADALGSEWVIPTLWSGSSLPPREERNWPLPYADQDWDVIESKTAEWLSVRYYNKVRHEWLYSQIVPQILVEPYIGSTEELPTDYKFLVFDGRVEYIAVHSGRQDHHPHFVAFYDRAWDRQPFKLNSALNHPGIPKPTSLDRMIAAAERLAKDTPFVRVDFYEIGGKPLFGEMTFYPGSGLALFPREYDLRLGRLLTYP